MTRFFINENPKFKSFYVLTPEGEVLEFHNGAFNKTELTPVELLNDSDISEVPDESFFPGRIEKAYTEAFSDEPVRMGDNDQIQGFGGSTIYNEDIVNDPNEIQELAPGANTQATNSGVQQMDDQFEECYTGDPTYGDGSRQSSRRVASDKSKNDYREALSVKIGEIINFEGLVPIRKACKFKYEIDYVDKNGNTRTFNIEALGRKEALSLFKALKGKDEVEVTGARNKGRINPVEEKTAEEQVKHNFSHVELPKNNRFNPNPGFVKKAQSEDKNYKVRIKTDLGTVEFHFSASGENEALKLARDLEKKHKGKIVEGPWMIRKASSVWDEGYRVAKSGKPSANPYEGREAAKASLWQDGYNTFSYHSKKEAQLKSKDSTPFKKKVVEADTDLEQSALLDDAPTYNGIGEGAESPGRYPQEPEANSYTLDIGNTMDFQDQRVAFTKIYSSVEGEDYGLVPVTEAKTGLGDCNSSTIPNQITTSNNPTADGNDADTQEGSPNWRKKGQEMKVFTIYFSSLRGKAKARIFSKDEQSAIEDFKVKYRPDNKIIKVKEEKREAQVLTDNSDDPQQSIAPVNPYPNASKSNSGGAGGYATKAQPPTESNQEDPTGTQGGGTPVPPRPTSQPQQGSRWQLTNGTWTQVPIA